MNTEAIEAFGATDPKLPARPMKPASTKSARSPRGLARGSGKSPNTTAELYRPPICARLMGCR